MSFFYEGNMLTFEVDNIRIEVEGRCEDEEEDFVSVRYLADLANWVCGNDERKKHHRFERNIIAQHTGHLVSVERENQGHPTEFIELDLIHLSFCNRLCQIARYWDIGEEGRFLATLFSDLGVERATNVLTSLRKAVWVSACESVEASIQHTAEGIRNIVREIVAERQAGTMECDATALASTASALSQRDAYVVSYQHQDTGPGLTPVSERLSEDQITEIATILNHHGKSKANQVHLAFDFTSVVGAQSEAKQVSWASTGLDVFKVAQVIHVKASRNRSSDWSQIEMNCAALYGNLVLLDPDPKRFRVVELGSQIEFETAELLLAQMLLSSLLPEATSTMWEDDLKDLEKWALGKLDTLGPTSNGAIPMLAAIAMEGTIRDEEEAWISLVANAGKGLMGNFRALNVDDKGDWKREPNYRRWRDIGVSEEMQEHARLVDKYLWGPDSIQSEDRFDYVFSTGTGAGCECFVIMTNVLSHRRHAWLIKGCFQSTQRENVRELWVAPHSEKLCPYNVLRALEWECNGIAQLMDELCRDLGMERWRKSKRVDLRGCEPHAKGRLLKGSMLDGGHIGSDRCFRGM